MSRRVTLPASLSRSGEGVTYAQPPPSPLAARTIQVDPLTPGTTSTTMGSVGMTETKSKDAFGFDFDTMTIIWLVLIPIVVWIILFTTKWNMVTDLVNGSRVINTTKLLLWTVVISTILLVCLYLVFVAWPSK